MKVNTNMYFYFHDESLNTVFKKKANVATVLMTDIVIIIVDFVQNMIADKIHYEKLFVKNSQVFCFSTAIVNSITYQ